MKKMLSVSVFLLCFIWLTLMVSTHLSRRPVAVKAGYLLPAEVLKLVCSEYGTVVADWSIIRTLFYFGTIIEKNRNNVTVTPEYSQMYYNLVQSLKLDPYNQDAYYFSQAIFTWDVGRISETNQLLDYGMRYRTWDWQLPFWAGFNSSYFLKDYVSAANYFQKAATLSKNPIFAKLAARYQYEAGQEELGIAFLETMIHSARNERVLHLYQIRKLALEALMTLKDGVEEYRQRYGVLPEHLSMLVDQRILIKLPEDPYGGDFFLDSEGRVRATSNLSFARAKALEEGNNQE